MRSQIVPKRKLFDRDCEGTPVEVSRTPFADNILLCVGTDTTGTARLDRGNARGLGEKLLAWANESGEGEISELEGAIRVEPSTDVNAVPKGSHNRQCPHCGEMKLPGDPDGACDPCSRMAASLQR